MAARRRGSIVNVASMAAKQGNVPYLSHYVASKFGVVGLTQAMAYELGPHGITANAVMAGVSLVLLIAGAMTSLLWLGRPT